MEKYEAGYIVETACGNFSACLFEQEAYFRGSAPVAAKKQSKKLSIELTWKKGALTKHFANLLWITKL